MCQKTNRLHTNVLTLLLLLSILWLHSSRVYKHKSLGFQLPRLRADFTALTKSVIIACDWWIRSKRELQHAKSNAEGGVADLFTRQQQPGNGLENQCGSSPTVLQMKSMHAKIMDMDFWLWLMFYSRAAQGTFCTQCCRKQLISVGQSIYTQSDFRDGKLNGSIWFKQGKTHLFFFFLNDPAVCSGPVLNVLLSKETSVWLAAPRMNFKVWFKTLRRHKSPEVKRLKASNIYQSGSSGRSSGAETLRIVRSQLKTCSACSDFALWEAASVWWCFYVPFAEPSKTRT